MPALRRHGLRNAAIPVVTVLGLQLATLLVGAVVVERVFVIPGLGSLLLDARRAAGPHAGAGRRDGPRRRRTGRQLRGRPALRRSSTRASGWASDEHRPRARTRERAPAGTRPGAPRSRRRPLGASLVVGGVLVALIVLMALVSFVWTPYDPTFVDAGGPAAGAVVAALVRDRQVRPRHASARFMVGSRTTLFVGVVAVGVAAVIGVPLGILAAMASAVDRRGAHARQRPAARVPGAAAGDHVRRGLRRPAR